MSSNSFDTKEKQIDSTLTSGDTNYTVFQCLHLLVYNKDIIIDSPFKEICNHTPYQSLCCTNIIIIVCVLVHVTVHGFVILHVCKQT